MWEYYETIDTKNMFIFIGRITETFLDESCFLDNVPEATKIDPVLCTLQGFYKWETR